jgi:hypothetical protein
LILRPTPVQAEASDDHNKRRIAKVVELMTVTPQHLSPTNASARPELENSQDPKRTRTVQDFLQRKFIIEAHFARRKSLM